MALKSLLTPTNEAIKQSFKTFFTFNVMFSEQCELIKQIYLRKKKLVLKRRKEAFTCRCSSLSHSGLGSILWFLESHKNRLFLVYF